MIISGGSRCNWRFFGKHLTNERDNGYVRVAEMRGLISDTVPEALREMDAIASGTRCKNSFYHANINPRPGEHLTEAQWEQAADTLERNLGLVGHARFVVEHEKNGRVHRHIIWSRIDVGSMTAVSDSFTAREHERTSRELEEAFGLEPVESVLLRDRDHERPERRPKNWETFRGYGSGIDPQDVKREVTALWNAADSGLAFMAALADHGYVLCKGDRRDFCIVDSHGNEHSLARRIEGQKAAAIRARMADIDRDELPSVAQAKEQVHSHHEAHAALPPDEPATVETSTAPDEPAQTPDPVAVGFWGAVADYASRILDTIAGDRRSSPWSVEECQSFLQANTPDTSPSAHTLDDYAAPLEDAIRAHGEIPTRDGQTWWQRAGYAIAGFVDTATTWAKERFSTFVERLQHERGIEPDDLDLER